MSRKNWIFAFILLPFLSLSGQKRDFVFDPKKLLPATTARIDSTAEKIYRAGMSEKSNISLFMESIHHIGTLSEGSDIILTEYCLSFDSLCAGVRKNTLEKTLHRNINFLKNHTLHSSASHTWTLHSDSITPVPHRHPVAYMIRGGTLRHVYGNDSLSFTSLQGTYTPYDGVLHIRSAKTAYPRRGNDSLYYHVENCLLYPEKSYMSCLFSRIDIPSYRIKDVQGTFIYTAPDDSQPSFSSHEGGINISDSAGTFFITGRLCTAGRDIYMEHYDDIHARMTVKRSDDVFAAIHGERIWVRDSVIRIPSSAVSLYMGQDSLIHPCVMTLYDRLSSVITFYQTEEKLSSAPFFNSYSSLKLFSRAVQADGKSGDIWFSFDPAVNPLVISDRYFEPEIYRRFRGSGTYNPLPDILASCSSNESPSTPIEKIARDTRTSTSTAILTAMEITRLGYGYYDSMRRTLSLYPGFGHMVSAARGDGDYDGIAYYGEGTKDIVARMDGETGHINLSGMKMVKLSPSGDVFLSPDSAGIRAEKKGNFSYSGGITLGLFTIDGQAAFDYDENSITLQGSSRMSFRVPSSSMPDVFVPVLNTLDSLRGSITLNAPHNKASRGKDLRYPMLSTTQVSYVFYPHLDSLYGRDELYVTIEPFTIDSISSRNTQGIRFDGTLHTGGIVPPFKREIKVLDDHTLGFEQADFRKGVDFYGRGNYKGTMSLDGKGITGKGSYTYRSAEVTSEELHMLPGRVYSSGQARTMESDVHDTPISVFDSVYVTWDVTKDTLHIHADSSRGYVYRKDMEFSGKVFLTSSSMGGSGVMSTGAFIMQSDDMTFHKEQVTSPMADITFGTVSSPSRISMHGVHSVINPSMQTGDFFLTDFHAVTRIPSLHSSMRMPQAHWDMEGGSVLFSSEGENGMVHLFTHTADSLSLHAGEVHYDITADTMLISGINEFHVADAVIIPPAGIISAGHDGKITPLHGGEIILDTSSRMHRLYDARIEILSDNDIKASATYDYTDADGMTYPMLFTDISTDSTGHVVAAADTYMREDYALGAYFTFRGQSTLKGSVKGLGLRGRISPTEIICPSVMTGSMMIDAPVGDSLRFTPAGDDVVNGIVATTDGFKGIFMGESNEWKKSMMTSVVGEIRHDDWEGIYMAEQTAPVRYPLYRFYNDECRINTRGRIFFNDPSGHSLCGMAGECEMDLNSGDLSCTDVSLALDMEFPPALHENLAILASQMALTGRKQTQSDSWKYLSSVHNTAGGVISLSGMEFTMQGEGSFTLIHSGEVFLNSIFGMPMESRMMGRIAITKSPTGADEIVIYLHGGRGKDFIFLRYKNGTADFLCSDGDIMKSFDGAVEKYRDAVPPAYMLRRATRSRVSSFATAEK